MPARLPIMIRPHVTIPVLHMHYAEVKRLSHHPGQPGSERTIKITCPGGLAVAEACCGPALCPKRAVG